ncbi:MAG TPA: mitofilin family membrane protein [Paracoccaceae bacterium]|nr:mitofilin family membrane protein [Paracoccaceae bacterium]
MANSSIKPGEPGDPGRRDGDRDDPATPATPDEPGRTVDVGPGEGRLVAAGRDDLLDPDAPEPTLVAAGRDDLSDRPGAAGTHDLAVGGTAPAVSDDPIGPGGPGGDEPPDGPHHDDHDDGDEHSRSFAARALMLLIFALVIFGLSLWLVPKVAPHLPAGIARHLMPAQVELDERLAALDERIGTGATGASAELAALREEVASLSRRIETAEQAAATAQAAAAESAASAERNAVAGDAVARAEALATEANRLAETATTTATEAGERAAAATSDTASLVQRMTAFETRMTELSDQMQAVSDSLAEGAADGEAAAPELAAAFAALRAEVEGFRERLATDAQRFATQDDLRSARTALQAEIQQALQALPPADAIVVEDELQALRQEAEEAVGMLEQRIAEVQATAEQAAETAGAAEQAATTAVGRVDDAIRDARLAAASASLTSRLTNGVAFADALDEAAALMDTAAPQELATVAAEGVATTAELLRGFGRPARDAIEADIEARTGGGILGQASARVRSVIGGRPAGEQPGESVEAILSRVEARLREGDAAAAMAEAGTLPGHAQAALGDWLGALRARVEAAEAAGQWLSPGGGGTQG